MAFQQEAETYFEDVQEGLELPPVVREITLPQMAMYAAVCWDFMAIHYDSGTAQSLGFRAAFTDGPMETALLCQVVTNWAGTRSILRKVTVTYWVMVFAGDCLTCRGRVIRKYRDGDQSLVECEIWAENREGQRALYGTAVAQLPSRL